MTQLLESTRNYLKVSTKLGRRLSSYREDSSASETSLHVSSAENIKRKQMNRLSSLFTLETRKNSVSSEDRPAISILPSKVEPEVQDQPRNDNKKRRSSSSRKSTLSQPPSTLRTSQYMDHNDVPRGRSPTLSVASTMRSVASSSATSYDTRPSDYRSVDEYNTHVWRRTLLEESIMQSLNLGYGQPAPRSDRPLSQRRSRSLKRNTTGRSRKDLPPTDPQAGRKTVIDRNTSAPNRILVPQQEKAVNKNNPYQMLLNPSTSNITHSFASFTLELPEHQVTHVLSASAVPHLFTLKTVNGPSPSPHVLTGKAAIEQENMDPRHMHQAVAAAAV
ncbi:hypothetical protein BGZ80_007597 [Entomortierella chlamydospora]|uniref:Uncharacterized protein n=1 Tax=Entomortierella chlamydospora TaxID=101097 RepID=A0A9P6MEP3_9FUNG|nr:hypothetical protein BGZ80_007597 [Entomortierella chlamydospora]KAG0003212.1 hypothetical protein BGZ79_001434 [Entomortierella chlamydospora]